MSSQKIEYLKAAGLGAAFGISTSILSCICHETLGVSLGFSPVSINNLVKVGVLSGGTLTAFIAVNEKWNISDYLKF